MKCFPLMIFVFFLMKVYVVFSVRQENEQFNLSMMQNPNLNSIAKMIQNQQTYNPQLPLPQSPNNLSFDQFLKFYQMFNSINANANNNLINPTSFNNFPNGNSNGMFNPAMNLFQTQQPVFPQNQSPQLDTNLILQNLLSQIQTKQSSNTESNFPNNELSNPQPKIVNSKGNLRKKELSETIVKNENNETPVLSDKLKDDIKKLQELTLEANKIMANKIIKTSENEKDELLNSPEAFLKQNPKNGPTQLPNKIKDDLDGPGLQLLQQSIKTINKQTSENQPLTASANDNSELVANQIVNNFEHLDQLKKEANSIEEEHRKEEFEDKLNYLLAKLDVISKISDN